MTTIRRLPLGGRRPFAAIFAAALLVAALAVSPSLKVVRATGPQHGEATVLDVSHPTPWEYSAYQIGVLVKIDPSMEMTPKRRADLTGEIQTRARAIVGGLWRLTILEAPVELHWESAADLGRVSSDQLPQTALESDKIMLLGLTADAGDRRSIHVREFDVRTQLWGAPLAVARTTSADLADQCVHALWQSFSPLMRIDRIAEQGVMTCRIRGGALPLASGSLEIVRPRAVVRPLIRHFDAHGKTLHDGVFALDWTWLEVEQIDGPAATCRLVSGILDPFDLKSDGRTEYLGLVVATRASTGTDVIVHARGDNRALEDVEVFARDAGSGLPRLVGRTDEHGAVHVESPRVAVEMLYLRSGDDMLARFPIVAGLERSVTIAVEDNGRRLETGDLVARASNELTDLVAQQALLKTRLQRQLVAGRLDAAATTLAALKMLKTSEAFLKSLDARRAALPDLAGDAAAATWLDKRLAEIKPLAEKLLSSEDLARLETLLDKKRGAQQATPAAKTP